MYRLGNKARRRWDEIVGDVVDVEVYCGALLKKWWYKRETPCSGDSWSCVLRKIQPDGDGDVDRDVDRYR